MSKECNGVENLNQLSKQISDLQNNNLSQKNVLTFDEACRYTGIKNSYMYKLTSTGKIPHTKPMGKMIYFDRAELENWLLHNQAIHEEIEAQGSTYVTLNQRGGGKWS